MISVLTFGGRKEYNLFSAIGCLYDVLITHKKGNNNEINDDQTRKKGF